MGDARHLSSEKLAILEEYNQTLQKFQDVQAAKPDMQACRVLKDKYDYHSASHVFGHIAGVSVGARFNGRGEVAIVGLHPQILRGIHCRASETRGAYAIALSGAYKDDEDKGSSFVYTGEGGMSGATQVTDQEFVKGNLALKRNYETGCPVRVIRGKMEGGKRVYVYDGLYKVTAATRERSKDDPLVCKFTLEGVPGEHAASIQVEYKAMGAAYQGSIRSQSLAAGAASSSSGRKRRRSRSAYSPPPNWLDKFTREWREATLLDAQNLVKADISGGKERLPIPVYNQFAPAPLPEFEYITDYVLEEGVNLGLLASIDAEMAAARTCGMQLRGGNPYYNNAGCLTATVPEGLFECEEGRCAPLTPCCRGNAVVAQGVRLPLEVFRTGSKGWGVRCAVNIPIGAFVACYLGTVITSENADSLKGQDDYLYDLNHFHEVMSDPSVSEQFPDIKLLPAWRPEYEDHLLTVDARQRGNVARLINHSCNPNLHPQAVLTGRFRNMLLYYTALFAQEDIPAGTELTYAYNYAKLGSLTDGAQPCRCGSLNCSGVLRDGPLTPATNDEDSEQGTSVDDDEEEGEEEGGAQPLRVMAAAAVQSPALQQRAAAGDGSADDGHGGQGDQPLSATAALADVAVKQQQQGHADEASAGSSGGKFQRILAGSPAVVAAAAAPAPPPMHHASVSGLAAVSL